MIEKAPRNAILKARAMLDPLLKICFPHLLKMVWVLIVYWVIYVKMEDPYVFSFVPILLANRRTNSLFLIRSVMGATFVVSKKRLNLVQILAFAIFPGRSYNKQLTTDIEYSLNQGHIKVELHQWVPCSQ
jgi:hypothetical protein